MYHCNVFPKEFVRAPYTFVLEQTRPAIKIQVYQILSSVHGHINLSSLIILAVISCACAQHHPSFCPPLIHSVISNYSARGQWRPWSDCANAQSDLGLRCLLMAKKYIFAWWGSLKWCARLKKKRDRKRKQNTDKTESVKSITGRTEIFYPSYFWAIWTLGQSNLRGPQLQFGHLRPWPVRLDLLDLRWFSSIWALGQFYVGSRSPATFWPSEHLANPTCTPSEHMFYPAHAVSSYISVIWTFGQSDLRWSSYFSDIWALVQSGLRVPKVHFGNLSASPIRHVAPSYLSAI